MNELTAVENSRMTDAEVGQAMRWLGSIPSSAKIRIRILCDGCEMTFGVEHPILAGRCLQAKADTLDECLEALLKQREAIDTWIRQEAKRAQ